MASARHLLEQLVASSEGGRRHTVSSRTRSERTIGCEGSSAARGCWSNRKLRPASSTSFWTCDSIRVGSDLRPCRQRPCAVMMQVHGSRPQRSRSPRPRRVSASPGLGDARSHRVHIGRAADGVARQLSSRRRAHLGAHRSGQPARCRAAERLSLPSRSTSSIRSITRVGASP